MWHVYLDASSLAKRYTPEAGSAVVDHIMTRVLPRYWLVLNVGVGETVSVFVRKRNAGRITGTEFHTAMVAFKADILGPNPVQRINAGTPQVDASLPLIDRHAVNATDALVLQTALEARAALSRGNGLVLVASDQRLLTAAKAEGVRTFDPATQSAADFDALLAGPP